jgi:hypothetical protein
MYVCVELPTFIYGTFSRHNVNIHCVFICVHIPHNIFFYSLLFPLHNLFGPTSINLVVVIELMVFGRNQYIVIPYTNVQYLFTLDQCLLQHILINASFVSLAFLCATIDEASLLIYSKTILILKKILLNLPYIKTQNSNTS